MKPRIKTPDPIEMKEEELDALVNRIDSSHLSESDRGMVIKMLRFNLWLQTSLKNAELSIRRLGRLFGIQSEKRKRKGSGKKAKDSGDEEGEKQKKQKRKGHGRLGHEAYKGAETVEVKHPHLKVGDDCPLDCFGRLGLDDLPSIVIRITGSPLLKGTRFIFERLRCSDCKERFTAPFPKGVDKNNKYDAESKALISLQKYYLGNPFHRMETFQSLLGVPIPHSTQWELAEHQGDCAYPIFHELVKQGAQGEVLSNDDTGVKILSLIQENQGESPPKRKGMHTTAIVARVGARKMVLFFSSRRHAGENLDQVLKHRSENLPPPFQMADALSSSNPKEYKTIRGSCLTHGRRKFVDIQKTWPKECGYVLDILGEVYAHDAIAKEEGMSECERLAFHQSLSGPMMEELKKWLDQQIDTKQVTPHEDLGQAIQYMKNHWDKLTKFLEIAGAPLDNNETERALKIPIRNRKNANHYKTEHGARIADILMSVIYTCALAGENPYPYLVALQEHRKAVLKGPSKWLPWNWKEQINIENNASKIA